MARKTLGKMEFAQLIDTLQQQNAVQLEAQRETTKHIRNLHAYFLKQDRSKAREHLEDEMEEKKGAEKVGGKDKYKKIPSKGIFGKIIDFFLTGALGTASKGLFKTIWNSVKFGPGLYKSLAGFMGGLLLTPAVWDSIKNNIDKQESFTGKIDEIATAFFKKNDFLSILTGGVLVGGAMGGPKGAIAGALIFGGLSLVGKALGEDETFGDIFTGDVSPLLTGGLGLVGGALAGARLGAMGGVKGLVLGALIGGALGGVAGVFASKDMQAAISRNPLKFMMLSAGGAILGSIAGFKAGAMIGMVGGPLGMLFGGLVGLLLGALATYFLDKHFQSKVERTGKIKSLDAQILDEIAKMDAEEKSGIGPKYEKAKSTAEELSRRRNIAAQLVAGEVDKGDVGANLEGIVAEKDWSLAKTMLQEEANQIVITHSSSKAAASVQDSKNRQVNQALEVSGSQELAAYLKSYLQQKIDTGQLIQGNEHMQYKKWLPEDLHDNIPVPATHPLTAGTSFAPGFLIVDEMKKLQKIQKLKAEQRLEDKNTQARGFGAYAPGQMQSIVVGDQPTAQGQELVFTEKKFNQIIGDILDNNRLKDQRNMAMAMLPAMSQGSGGASMPVVNNSYSYQNVDNIVTELPATSTFNMTNALA